MEEKEEHPLDCYFTSPGHRVAFCLIHSDGEARMEQLDVKRIHYSCLELSTKWRDGLMTILDQWRESLGDGIYLTAVSSLTVIYSRMTYNEFYN